MGANNIPAAEIIEVKKPDGAALVATAQASLTEAQAIIIDSPEMYAVAADDLKDVKRKLADLTEREASLISPLSAVIQSIRDLFRPAKERLVSAESAYKGAMLTYQQAEAAKAAEAQRIANEAATQARLKAEAEAAEAQAKADEAEQSGNTQLAAELHSQAQVHAITASVASAPAVVSAAPKIAGVSVRTAWKCELPKTDDAKIAALKHIIANPQFLHLAEFSQSECDKLARALKSNLGIPGLRPYEHKTVASGR